MENLQGMTDEQLMALYKQKYPKGKPQEQTAQATAQSQPNIAALLQTITGKPTLGDRVQGGLKGMADAGAQIYGGVKPNESQSKITDLLMQEAIKKQFEDPMERQVNLDYKRAATERALRDPFYMSPQGQEYYQARTGQAQAQGQQASTETDIMNQVKGQLGNGQNVNANITPGTTVQAGPYNIPLNPKLDADQAAAISSSQVFTPQVENIAKEVKGGIFGPSNTGMMGDIKRTARQFATDSGIPLLTFGDPKLQAVQGELNSIRRYAFGEGGKNLTGTEKQIVYALLNTMGKNDDQIVSDHQKALATIQSKSQIALGGRNAALNPQTPVQNDPNDFSAMSDEELRRIASGGA